MSFREDILGEYGSLPPENLIKAVTAEEADFELFIADINDYQQVSQICLESVEKRLFRLNRSDGDYVNFLKYDDLLQKLQSAYDWIVLSKCHPTDFRSNLPTQIKFMHRTDASKLLKQMAKTLEAVEE